ncbi:MAG: lysophospholipid acyltransferase family protein [Terriglobales bacterium]
MRTLRSLLVWAFTWAYMLLAGILSLPWLLCTRRLGFIYALARVGIRALLALAGVRLQVLGREHLIPGSVLYMANHQSNLDPPLALAVLPGELAYLAKQQLFSVPLLGLVLRVGGLVPVDRSNRAAASASIARAAASLRAGRPFIIFPEGTRSPDGRLLEFKKGPFYLAEQAQTPVVPVAISGSGACMPRGQWRIHPGLIRVSILPPIPLSAWATAPEPRAALAAQVRARLQAATLET